jgi:hypothetical protein
MAPAEARTEASKDLKKGRDDFPIILYCIKWIMPKFLSYLFN